MSAASSTVTPIHTPTLGREFTSPRFGFVGVNDVLICVNSAKNPEDEEWQAYVLEGRAMLARYGEIRVLVFSLGGGPNASQRSQINEEFKDRPQRVAVMLNSLLVRGMVTALSWFNSQIRAFNLEQIDQACTHLGLSPLEARQVQESLHSLKVKLKLPANVPAS